MKKEKGQSGFENLPLCVAGYIRLVIKKMRWRKKVRSDVQAELIAHFEDALKDCKTDEEKERTAKEIIDNFGDAKILGVLARRAKKRCRPLWQKTMIKAFQTFGIIIGLFILYVTWFLSGRPEITTNYVEIANNMIKPKAADDPQNAAPYYEKASKLIESQDKQTYECIRKDFTEANEIDIAQIKQWLDKNTEALNLIEQGTAMPYCWQTYHGELNDSNSMLSILMPNLGKYRTLAHCLRWRAYLSAEDGQYEKAFADLLTAYTFGKHQKSKATLVENLVGMAIKSLSTGTCRTILSGHKIPTDELASFSNDLQAIVKDEDFTMTASFGFEKLFIYDEIQRCFTSNRFGVEHLYPKRLVGLMGGFDSAFGQLLVALYISFTHPTHPDKQETRQMADAYYDFWERTAAETPFELKERDLTKEVNALIKDNILLEILAPAMQKVAIMSWRIKADAESTLSIIAILRFKQEKGRLPDDLQELITAGYLKSLPMDPFSDKPLVYKKTQDGFTYYSVGQDFIDNGGKAYEIEPGKYRIWADSNDGDAVFWPVASRLEKAATNSK
ncbi:MAG: hypothetical protein CVV39_07545 [Planctomycetes bacterium HGW-Planctomycetes-1]|nr:MAG: hypothetical protein CVV39_07545 [Planctomycetes bacterium HGW-Planctomycetes-1]